MCFVFSSGWNIWQQNYQFSILYFIKSKLYMLLKSYKSNYALFSNYNKFKLYEDNGAIQVKDVRFKGIKKGNTGRDKELWKQIEAM